MTRGDVFPSTEIIVATLGTMGDIHPFLALSLALLEAGYKVTVLSNGNWRTAIGEIGADFVEIAPPDPSQSGRDDYAFFVANTLPSFRRTFDFIAGKIRSNPRCVLLYRSNMLGAECAAEKFNIPNIKVALQPAAIRSYRRPPWPLTGLAQGRLGAIAQSVIIPAVYAIGEIKSPYRRHTNAFRRSIGLRDAGFLHGRRATEDIMLLMCPDWYAMPQSDWPENCHQVGFPFYGRSVPDCELEAFIGGFGPPMVFTPGTGVHDVAQFFERAEEICRLLDMPAVFLSPTVKDLKRNWPRGIACRDFVSLGWLLPRSCLLVHHGGIGSTAQAIRAGVPQIVVPERFDQPDNALRVATLGLGAAVFCKHFQSDVWADLIRLVLSDEDIQQKLATASRLISAQNAPMNALDLIERLIGTRFRGGGNPGRTIGDMDIDFASG